MCYDFARMIDQLVIPDFLDAAEREQLISEMLSAEGGPSTVYGKEASGVVDSLVRKVTRLNVSQATSERIARKLLDRKGEVESRFALRVSTCEEPQFLRYRAGDFFVAHQDGNTPVLLDDSRFRKVSVVIFLNRQSEEPAPGTYGGGSLVFHGAYPDFGLRFPADNTPGNFLAFRAETTHEVVPVTRGERYTIISWYR